MNITVAKSDILKGLNLTEGIGQKKSTMPILLNVLLTAEGSTLKISATDLEVSVMTDVIAQVNQPGRITVNTRVFTGVVRELPDGDILLRISDNNRLHITSHNSNMKMVGVTAEEYPNLPGVDLIPVGGVSSQQLLEMINKTIFAVSTDEGRFNLNGICFSLTTARSGGKLLRLVATDGHRLALATRAAADLDFSGDVIVPRKGLLELKKLLDGLADTKLGIAVEKGFLLVQTSTTKMAISLIDGEFPDYRQVIPKETGEIATANCGELMQALRRVMLMVTDKGKCVKFEFADNCLRMSGSSAELGEATEELAIEYSGDALSVAFNAKYLLDIGMALGDSIQIKMELNGPLGPGKFYAAGDEACVGIIMPMRLT